MKCEQLGLKLGFKQCLVYPFGALLIKGQSILVRESQVNTTLRGNAMLEKIAGVDKKRLRSGNYEIVRVGEDKLLHIRTEEKSESDPAAESEPKTEVKPKSVNKIPKSNKSMAGKARKRNKKA